MNITEVWNSFDYFFFFIVFRNVSNSEEKLFLNMILFLSVCQDSNNHDNSIINIFVISSGKTF